MSFTESKSQSKACGSLCALAARSQFDAPPLHAHSLHPSDMCVNRRKTWVKWWGCAHVMRGVSLHIKQQDDVEIGDSRGREMRRGEKWRGGWWRVKIRGDWEQITWGQGGVNKRERERSKEVESTYPDPVLYWGHRKLRSVIPVEPTNAT